jgi:hypothetical protein
VNVWNYSAVSTKKQSHTKSLTHLDLETVVPAVYRAKDPGVIAAKVLHGLA